VDRHLSADDARIEAIKAELRARGWYLRYTEWPSGHQVVLHARADTARALVTDWHEGELAAWRAALRLAEAWAEQQRGEPAAPLH
jgi:hypothetical protein